MNWISNVYPLSRWFRAYNKLICYVVKRNVIHELLLFWDRNCNHHMRWTFVRNQQFSLGISMRAFLIISHDMVFLIDLFLAHSRGMKFLFLKISKTFIHNLNAIQWKNQHAWELEIEYPFIKHLFLVFLLWLEFLRLRLHSLQVKSDIHFARFFVGLYLEMKISPKLYRL